LSLPISRPVILTGDRATGPLHLGHYAGTLRNRVALQGTHEQYLLIADLQALTDHVDRTGLVRKSVLEIALDYLAVGVDPDRTVICLQSGLPALAELSLLYLNLVTVSRLERIPTIREEITARGFGRAVPAGFLCYPVAQAADITAFRAELVPVGADQAPLIEITNEVVRRVNALACANVLPEARALIPEAGRLPAADGRGKMSKSAGTALPLSATPDQIAAFVRSMFTDPSHLRVADPGRVEGNVVFEYLDAFDPDRQEVERLKERYRAGGLGDGLIKRRLDALLQELIRPIRERRFEFAKDPGFVREVIAKGTRIGRERTEETRDMVYSALRIATP
jgi:tryptophanyl-tRNA synthetase